MHLYKYTYKLLPAFTAIFLCACTPKIYQPYPHVSPLLQEKGEGVFNLQLGTAAVGVSAAYAPAKHLEVLMNISIYDSGAFTTKKSPDKYNIFEFGGGYFTRIGSEGSFELLGGGGFGNRGAVSNNSNQGWPYTQNTIRTDLASFFIQPGIGFTGEKFEFGFNVKFNCVSYPNFYFQKRVIGNTPSDSVATQWGPYAAIEPAFYIAKGNELAKVFMQFGFSVPVMGKTVIYNEQAVAGAYISFGLILRLKNSY